MTIGISVLRFRAIAAILTIMLLLAACQVPQSTNNAEFQALSTVSLENPGAIIEEPNIFRIAGGQQIHTPFSVDCSKLSADAAGWRAALAAGAQKVAISLPDQPHTYGGVLALCLVHRPATGPLPSEYQLMIPADKVSAARDGLIVSVAQQANPNGQGTVDTAPIATGQASLPQTSDLAWILWFSDRPESLGVFFSVSGVPSAVSPPAPLRKHLVHRSAPPLTKGGSYTLISPLKLRSGPKSGSPVVTPLNTGDAVVASGEEKNGFWAVTTVGGQTGWILARDLKAN